MCPTWCTTDHVEYVADGGDPLDHYGRSFDSCLPEVRNYVDGRVERDGGAAYNIGIARRSMDGCGGWEGPSVVELLVRDLDHQHLMIRLTSGEARTLARRLEVLADVMDLHS